MPKVGSGPGLLARDLFFASLKRIGKDLALEFTGIG